MVAVELPPQPASEITEANTKVEITIAPKRFIIPPEERSRSAVRAANRAIAAMHVRQFLFTTCSFVFTRISGCHANVNQQAGEEQCSGGEIVLE